MNFPRSCALQLLVLMAFSAAFAGETDPGGGLFSYDEMIKYQRFVLQDVKLSGASTPSAAAHPAVLPPKSKGKAFLLSFILPGLGERYIGDNRKAAIFMAAEVTLWLSYAGFVTYRDWRKEDYKTYAAAHAGVGLDGKSESYFVDVGNYNSIYDYNAAKLRQRNLNDYYRDVDSNYWQWESEQRREKFDQLRISADRADNRSLFVIGAIFANHILSAIDAIWTTHKYEKRREKILDVQIGDGVYSPAVLFSVTARF
jgi:hypothetical protein